MRTHRVVLAALCAAAVASCSVKVDPLAPEAQVTCGSDADCPSGFFCSQVLDRCVARGGADQTAPTIVGTPTITPSPARAGALVTVTFEVSEPLSQDPDVRLAGAAEPLGSASHVGLVYTVEFTPPSSLGAGQKTVVASLVDLYGNETQSTNVGSFLLDLTAPAVVASAFPAFARAGAFSGTLTFDAPLGEPPSLTIAGGPALAATEGPGANQWTFSRTLAGTEPAGPVDLLLVARDPAGNLLDVTLPGVTTFDFTAPTVAETVVGTPAVRGGDTFLASVRFSEALGPAAPVFTLVPAGGGTALPVTASAIDPTTYALSRDVAPGALDASYTLTLVSAADRAGNPAAGAGLGAVTFDSTPPVIGPATLDHANRLYRAGQSVQVSFTLGETPAAEPAVRLDLLTVALTFSCTHAGLAYTCTSDGPVQGTFPEGPASLSISAADRAGNVGTGASALVLDFTPPGLASPPASRYLGSFTTLGVTVSAVGTGSSYELSLLTNEPLAAAPTVIALAPGGAQSRPLSLTASNAPANTSFTFTLPASATAYASATWAVQWTATDAAGNTHATPQQIATVEVDGVPPAAPVTGAATSPALTWTRIPWGTDTSATPVFQLEATLASVGADAKTVVAWDGAGAGAREVGRASPTGGPPFVLPLASDPAELYASSLDRAGNESPRTRVVDVVWTAGLAGKVPGSTFENPHRLESRGRSLGALTQIDGVQPAGTAVGVRGDGQVVTTTAAALYRPVATTADPGPRILYSLGADPGRGVIVLQGGMLPGSRSPGDTWEWNGSSWRQVFPSDPEGDGNGPTLGFAPLVYDPIRAGLLTYTGSLLLWNGTSWRNFGAGPVAGGVITWDARRAVVVLYGNDGGTYEWSGGSWRNALPAATVSPSRAFAALFYDTVAQQVCLYGGRTQSGTYLGDHWCYDGARWTAVPTAGTAPFARSDYAYAWDAARGELFLQSGRPEASTTVDGKTWVLRRVAGTPTWFDVTPATLDLRQHGATYDPASERVIMAGDLTLAPSTLRAWNGTGYVSLSPGDPEGDGNPSFLFRTSNPVYVPARNRVVFAQAGTTLETWEWDRVSWALRATGGASTATGGLSSGWLGSNLITFGGNKLNVAQGDTWAWNGTAWSLLEAGPVHPPAAFDARFRTEAGLVTDAAGTKLYRVGGADVYFSGSAQTSCILDVWEWTGATWVLSTGGGPAWNDPEGDGTPTTPVNGIAVPCRCRERVVWSPALNTILLLDDGAGAGVPYVVWEWRRATTSWARHTLTGATSAVFQGFFWDTSLAAPVIVDSARIHAVDLAGNRALLLSSANPYGATPPSQGTFAFDTGLGTAVAVEALPWSWESPAKGSPAQLFTADYARAGGPDPAVCVTGAACPIQRVELTWSGGGTAPTGNGATIQAWTGSWLDVATNGSTAAAPSVMTYAWTPASTVPAALLFHGTARELTFALVPNGTSAGVVPAQLGTDAVAVTIRYRRP